jgi:serine/threonine-protein kinase
MDEQEEALSVRAQARLGTTLRGKYRLDRVLGIGGMATVFAATHRNQAELAVKLLHPELSLREDLKKRFLREGYVGNSVKHPGAVLVVDDDIAEDGSAFLVMELLRGKSLEELWERSGRRLSSRVVVSIVLQLLEVLAAAHEKAIVHRDLKPANIFLTADGTVKVLDFGIARLRDAALGSEHATRTGTLMGTPAFMAPEQAQAIAAEIDGQTDLWAAGATMFTLLSGELVHDGENSSQLLIRAGTARARPLLKVAPEVEPAIADVVDRALTFEKAGRWPSALAMREALQAAATTAFGSAPGRDVLTTLTEMATVRARIDSNAPTIGDSMAAITPPRTPSGANDATLGSPTGTPLPSSSRPSPVGSQSRPPRLPGLSTSNPVSAEAPATRRSVPVTTAIGGAVALVALMGAGFVLFSRHTDPAPSPPLTTVAVAPTQSSAVQVVPPPPDRTPAPPSPPPPPSAPPSAAAAPSSAPVAAPPPPALPKPKAPPATGTSKPPPAAAVDCTTAFTLDLKGNKHWKPECVQ